MPSPHQPHGDDPSVRDGYIRVRDAREHNLQGVDVDIPRDVVAVFTGVSGSGKSSLAFGTIYAEAQRRYFESVAPYARRLIHQVGAPKVGGITGLPPAVSLQQRRSAPTSRSSVGTITNLSNSLRMLFSRAGDYPPGAEHLDSDAFSPNTAAGACPECHGLGEVHRATEESLVPDPSLSIREGAIAAWPGAWQGKNLRDILDTLGHDVDVPWRELPAGQREWILFTDEQPVVILDEPTTGLHPADVEVLMRQLHGLVDAGHTVIVVEHDMSVVAGTDRVIDLGPSGGHAGGRIVATGTPEEVARAEGSATAPYLRRTLGALP